MIACIDLFCGAGGLTHGLLQGGVPVVAGVDNWEECRYPYEFNNKAKFVCQDINTLSGGQLTEWYGDAKHKILAGCAPCQPFSGLASRYNVAHDARYPLMHQFARLVKEANPHIVVMENVSRVRTFDVFQEFVYLLKCLSFTVSYSIVDCSKYGLPQTRRRLVLLASRETSRFEELKILPPEPNQPVVTLRDTIGRLPPIMHGETHPADAMHKAAALAPINAERIRASRPGGTLWDWPEHLRPSRYRKPTTEFFRVHGRTLWDNPAPTMTTEFYSFGSGRYGHPEQDRALSLREGALLQSFPSTYEFAPAGAPLYFNKVGRMIGNAVPPLLGTVIGLSICKHIMSEDYL